MSTAPSSTPDRSHYDRLQGQPVRLTLHPWARQGPTEGVLLGRGEWGITLRVEGGGRWIYRYDEVAAAEGDR